MQDWRSSLWLPACSFIPSREKEIRRLRMNWQNGARHLLQTRPHNASSAITFGRIGSPGAAGYFQQIIRHVCFLVSFHRTQAKPGKMYPGTNQLKSTRPTYRGPQRQVFVAGVERAATSSNASEATPSPAVL